MKNLTKWILKVKLQDVQSIFTVFSEKCTRRIRQSTNFTTFSQSELSLTPLLTVTRYLGMVHDLYTPVPMRFKDYIAMPKPNMYQSLHTTVIGPNGTPFEIQIRTWEMHRIAENGIAAHWKYKEGISGKTDMDSKLEWVRQLLDTQTNIIDTDDFI